ncbi:MAG: helicase RepA family protein [bacterium]|nr:helicase RepA family protein [bacterium]MDY4635077.1 helicase RepA family protein [Candidatus Limivicinus sp.]
MEHEREKTTVPIPPVGAGREQPISNTSAESIAGDSSEINDQNGISDERFEEIFRQLHCVSDPAYMPTVTLNQLFEEVFPSRPPIIDGLLHTGTYLLAGASKVGKSFLVAQIAYHVSTGQPLWDNPVRKGTVLYLALEDDYRRLQERMSRMFGVEGNENLFFSTCAKTIGNGLGEQIELFIQEHPNTNLIIIDTLQKVREASGETYSYASDYEVIGQLKKLADTKGICFLIVHHTRKQQAGDKFEMISGTTGLLGCADGAFLLQKERRTDLNATLEIVGRDQPDQRLYLTRDTEKLLWQLDHAETELWKRPPDPLLDKIAAMITEDTPEWNGSATELVLLLQADIQPNILTRRLNVKAGELLNEYGIEYSVKRTRNGSAICLARKTA